MSSSASDRTVNKITLCGAIFAGVAYVGYTVVKQAFGKTFLRGDKRKEGKTSFQIEVAYDWLRFFTDKSD